MSEALRIAIIGNGPRALSVLERLAARLQDQPDAGVEIHYIDKQHPGTGRIWRQVVQAAALRSPPGGVPRGTTSLARMPGRRVRCMANICTSF